MKVSVNGKILEEGEAFVSVLDRGYLFGEGLFETFRSYDGALPFIDRHLKRMEWGATFIGLPFPHPNDLKSAVKELLKATGLPNGRVKIILSGKNAAGFRPVVPTDALDITVVIGCEKFAPRPDEEYENGVTLSVIRSVKNMPPPLSNLKSLSSLEKMIARREFLEKDAFDGILLDAQGNVTETTSSNIFWVSGGKLFTSPVSIGLLPGVTREIVIEIARAEGIEFAERAIDVEGLKESSEVFLTGSTLEVMPVTEIDRDVIGGGSPGKITKRLRELYSDRLKEEIGRNPPSLDARGGG